MPEGGGRGPWDEVGTLIINKNLESNFPTFGIRTQFKVHHLGMRFSFQSYPPKQEFQAIWGKRLCVCIACIAPWYWRAPLSLCKINLLIKLEKEACFLQQLAVTQWIHKPQNISMHYSWANWFNHYSVSKKYLKIQSRTWKLILLLFSSYHWSSCCWFRSPQWSPQWYVKLGSVPYT